MRRKRRSRSSLACRRSTCSTVQSAWCSGPTAVSVSWSWSSKLGPGSRVNRAAHRIEGGLAHVIGDGGRGGSAAAPDLRRPARGAVRHLLRQPVARHHHARHLPVLWSHTSYDGDRFEYTGTGGELFRGFVIAMGILILLIGGAVGAVAVLGKDIGR